MKNILFIVFTMFAISANAQRKDYLITLETNKGIAHIILYDETPLHKANFIKLVKSNFYDSLLFHRVISNFMIQGGDPTSRKVVGNARLGGGGSDMERIPYEFTPTRVHKKGALAAARDNNPQKNSSGCQFYLVHGKKMADEEVTKVEKLNNIKYTNQQRLDYVTAGGTASLDNKYTVFGEIIDNIKLVDDIVAISTDEFDRPTENVFMKITAKKMRKRKITKKFGYKYLPKVKA